MKKMKKKKKNKIYIDSLTFRPIIPGRGACAAADVTNRFLANQSFDVTLNRHRILLALHYCILIPTPTLALPGWVSHLCRDATRDEPAAVFKHRDQGGSYLRMYLYFAE